MAKHQTFPKPVHMPKKPNRTTDKARAKRRRASEAVKRDVYALVDTRDGGACRSCGVYSMGALKHHHHIVFRSQGGPHTTENIVTLCANCHAAAAATLTITGSADATLLMCDFSRYDMIKGWESPCPS